MKQVIRSNFHMEAIATLESFASRILVDVPEARKALPQP